MDVFDLVATIRLNTGEYDKGLSSASQKTSSFGDKLKNGLSAAAKIGASAIAVGTTAVVGFAASSVKTGMEFDASMSKVAAISGATGSEFDSLRDKAIEMGSKTQFSASESADALTYMAMAGWKTGDMLDGIEGIMNLAAASGEDLATTSDIVTDALTAFGLSASDSGRFADIMAAASSNANTNVSMLGESFKYVAPVAGALGYSAEDVSVALGLMAGSGIKASQAGTTLRTALTNMASPTKNMAQVMDEYGISLTDADGNMLSLQDVMGQLRDKMGGLDQSTQASAASMLFGKEAMSGMLAIINASDADFEKLTTAIDECDGAAEQMAATMNDNLNGDIVKFNSALEGAKIILSDQLTPNLREFVKFGTDAISTLSAAFKEGGLTGAMEALGTILSDGLNMIIEQLPAMVDAGMQLIGALGQGLLDNLPAITDAAIEIIMMLVNGIVEALPALAEGAVQIITELANGIGEALPELIPKAVEAVLKFIEGLTNPESFSNLIGGALKLIEGLIDGIVQAVPLLIAYAPEIVANIVTGIIAAIPKLLEVGVQLIMGLIEGLIQGILAIPGAIIKVVDAIVDGFKALFGIHSPSTVFAEMGLNLIAGLLEGISGAWNSIVEFFSGAVQALTSFLSGAWENIRSAASSAWEAIKSVFAAAWEGIQAVFSGVVEFFSSIWDGIQGVFSSVAEVLGGFFRSAWEAVQGAWEVAKDFFGSIADGIRSAFEAVTQFLGDAFSAAWEIVDGVWGAAVDFFSGVWDGITGVFGAVAEWFGNMFSKAWDAVTSAWDGATEFFSGVWENIKGVFSDVWGAFKNIGGNIVGGIKDGVMGAWDSFWGWLSGKVGGIIDGVKSMLGIHSPSKVFAGIGQNMVLGLADGWNDEYSGIKRQIERGLDFGPARIGLDASYSGAARHSVQDIQTRGGGMGNTTVNIYSPKAVDAVQAAREWKKTAQRMAMEYS